MKRFVAVHRFPYAGRSFDTGEDLPVPSDAEGDLLVKMGHARAVERAERHLTRSLETGAEKQSVPTRQQSPRILTKAA